MPPPKDPVAFEAYREKMRTIALERGYGKWMLGKKMSTESIEKSRAANLGKEISVEHREALRRARNRELAEGKELFGGKEGQKRARETNTATRAGRTYEEIYGPDRAGDERRSRRETNRRTGEGRRRGNRRPKHNGDYRYREWRRAVFDRDNHTCRRCGNRGGQLHAHHVKSWADHPDDRYVVDNGLTLHEECHRRLHRELREAT